MRWSDVVWRWLLCSQLYTMCILRELATAISEQVTSVRRWDCSNTVQNGYGTVSLHGTIVNITENRVIVIVYLQELSYILLVTLVTSYMLDLISYELMRHNLNCSSDTVGRMSRICCTSWHCIQRNENIMYAGSTKAITGSVLNKSQARKWGT